MHQPLSVTMVGTGYVGLVTGVCLAELGATVTCVDKETRKIDALCHGHIPIYEPGLQEVMAENKARLTFTTQFTMAVKKADIIFIAVGTPTDETTGEADLTYVFQAAEEIGRALEDYAVIVTKSTVPVGTNRRIKEIMSKVTDIPFDVASNPEFLREGSAVYDFMNPDRIIIGTETAKAQDIMTRLYDPLCDDGVPRLRTGLETAEMIKYGANAFLATKIGFINALADLCEVTGADVRDVAKGMGMDKRIGRAFLNPGPGYGGSCFPKDTLALKKTAENYGAPLAILDQVIATNDARKKQMAKRIEAACGGNLSGKTIGVLGLTFKANTDDTRESPAMEIVAQLLQEKAIVQAFDPKGGAPAQQELPTLQIMSHPEEVANNADVLVILTEWAEFVSLDYTKMAGAMKKESSPLLDCRNLLDATKAVAYGFDYHPLGYVPFTEITQQQAA
ncbi:UDP-glucose/GDP-mannose dehydrogenase family protein [Alphaproteobacteria bacterium]|nr:UDP-glucose/GDP-mannose dehydrogenase family protein [Alphaproteobacteria bacterium]